MIVLVILIILIIIAGLVFAMKLSELDDEVQNLYELLSDYQMRSKENEN